MVEKVYRVFFPFTGEVTSDEWELVARYQARNLTDALQSACVRPHDDSDEVHIVRVVKLADNEVDGVVPATPTFVVYMDDGEYAIIRYETINRWEDSDPVAD